MASSSAAAPARRASQPFPAVVDALLDAGLAAFAIWTLLYELSLAFGLSLWAMVWVWAPMAGVGLCVAVAAVLRRRSLPTVPGAAAVGEAAPTDSSRSSRRPMVACAIAAGASMLALLQREWTLLLLVGLSLVGLVVALVIGRRPARTAAGQHRRDSRPLWEHLFVALIGVGAAVFSSFLLNTDADDAYYVNRSVWIAEHGSAPIRDTMFGPLTLDSGYGGGLPLASIEGLAGAVAHVTGVSAASVAYLVSVPVVAFFAVWVMWRLARAWAPRTPLMVLLVALLFIVFSGAGAIGNYSFGRLWQGKVMAVTLVIPMIWYSAGNLLTRRSNYDLAMMFVLGICFVGFTSSATILTPVISVALMVVASIVRNRLLAVGAILLLLAPAVSGLVLALFSTTVGQSGSMPGGAWGAYTIVLGSSAPMAAVAVLALVLLPLTVRRGPLSVLAGAASAIVFVSLLPGVIALVNAVTGAGPVLWRLLLGAPVAIAVGLLTTWDVPPSVRNVSVAVPAAAALAVLILVAGVPIWSAEVGATFTSRPTWKVNQEAQPIVARIARLRVGTGPVLLPPAEMSVLPVTTTRMFAVVPRVLYAEGIREPRARKQARFELYGLVAGHRPLLSPQRTRDGLRELDVSLVCVDRQSARVIARVSAAGYRRTAMIERLVCLTRPS